MQTKHYSYPQPIPSSKALAIIVAVLMPILSIFLLAHAKPSDYDSTFDYLAAILLPLLVSFVALAYTYSWCDVKVRDSGLLVEFLFGYFPVPWSEINGVKHIGSKQFGVWVVKLKSGLTPFHRFYGLFYLLSPSICFIVHTQSKAHNELIVEIVNHINKNQPLS